MNLEIGEVFFHAELRLEKIIMDWEIGTLYRNCFHAVDSIPEFRL